MINKTAETAVDNNSLVLDADASSLTHSIETLKNEEQEKTKIALAKHKTLMKFLKDRSRVALGLQA